MMPESEDFDAGIKLVKTSNGRNDSGLQNNSNENSVNSVGREEDDIQGSRAADFYNKLKPILIFKYGNSIDAFCA